MQVKTGDALPTIGSNLFNTNALLRAVSDHTNDLIFVKNCNGELLFANTATLRELGMTLEQALHRKSSELLTHAEQAERIDRDDQWVFQQRETLTLEQTLHMAAGARTYRTIKSPWFDDEGNLLGMVGIATDITVRKHAEDCLHTREVQLQTREAQLEATIAERTATLSELINHLELMREEEKRAIACELHGDMGATLTALSMHLQSAYTVFPEEEKWLTRKAKIQALLSAVVTSTRQMQTRLRPSMLDLFGLKTAISELLAEFGEQTGLVCKLSLPDEEIPIDGVLDIAIYRMLQEILNNVVKHANATTVNVVLDIDEDQLALTVRDDGIGTDAAKLDNAKAYGLRTLRERATFLGGSVSIGGDAGQGTTVTIGIPRHGL